MNQKQRVDRIRRRYENKRHEYFFTGSLTNTGILLAEIDAVCQQRDALLEVLIEIVDKIETGACGNIILAHAQAAIAAVTRDENEETDDGVD